MSSGFKQALTALVITSAMMGIVLYAVPGDATHGDELKLVGIGEQKHAAKATSKMWANTATTDGVHELRVCADPNNLPFSNERGEGFENRLAKLAAEDMGRTLTYVWWPQRRGFIRNTLSARQCDVVMGIPDRYEMAEPTLPYYRSSYVFVTRADRHLRIRSFDDPRLRSLRIGVHVIGDDYNSLPPAQALAMRGIVKNVRGYSIYGDYSQPNSPKALIDAVAKNEVDIAVVWGPFAGYFGRSEAVPLEINPVKPALPKPNLPMTFQISMGVRRGDAQMKARLNQFLNRRRTEIRNVLTTYDVPMLALTNDASTGVAR